VEKLSEGRTWRQGIPLTDRLDYFSGPSNNLPSCLAMEKLGGIEVPERGEYLRVIFCELTRIANHCQAVGFFLNDLGAMHTPLMYTFREREKILDMFELTFGARMTANYMRPGGVSQDVSEEFWPRVRKFVREMPHYIDEYEQLLTQNEILRSRTIGVGIMTREQGIAYSASGPFLRASGVPWDLRKNDPYSIYDRFQFDVPTRPTGDCYDRYLVRIAEMRQSVRILEQALKDVPKGPCCANVPLMLRLPPGDAYARIEAPKGELGVYIVSDGSTAPYRLKIRRPSFINLTVLRDLVIGFKVADVVGILGSIDIVLGEVDC